MKLIRRLGLICCRWYVPAWRQKVVPAAAALTSACRFAPGSTVVPAQEATSMRTLSAAVQPVRAQPATT